MKRYSFPITLIIILFSLWLLTTANNSQAAVNLPYTWTVETVDSTGDVGQFSSLAINPLTNLPNITYFDLFELNVRHASPTGNPYDFTCIGDWHCESFETDYADGSENSNTFTIDGQHRVLYYDTVAYKIMLLEDNGDGTFQTSAVTAASSDSRFAHLKYDSNGIAHTAFFQSVGGESQFNLIYATFVGTGGDCDANGFWECEIVEDYLFIPGFNIKSVSLDFALSFSGSDTPRLAYGAGGNGIKYAYPVANGGNCGSGDSSGKWNCEQIDQVDTESISLHVPKCSLVCSYPVQLAYYDKTSQTLRYAYKVDNGGGNCGIGASEGNWNCDTIMASGYGQNAKVSMAVHEGSPVIAFYDPDTNEGVLRVAYPFPVGNCGPIAPGGLLGTWMCDTVDTGYYAPNNNYHDVGQFASIGINSSGIVYISYYDATANNLKVATGVEPEPQPNPDPTPTPTPTPDPTTFSIWLPVIVR